MPDLIGIAVSDAGAKPGHGPDPGVCPAARPHPSPPMTRLTHKGSHRAIQAMGILLAMYLASLVGIAFVGQSRLQDALHAQDQLNAEKQASAIADFIASRQAELDQLARSTAVRVFLAGRAQDQPRQTGARDRRATLVKQFERALHGRTAEAGPLFRRLLLVGTRGHTLLEFDSAGVVEQTTFKLHKPQPGPLWVEYRPSGAVLTFNTPVDVAGKAGGSVIGEMPADAALRPLLLAGKRAAYADRHRTAVVDGKNHIISSDGGSPAFTLADDSDRTESPVDGHDLRVVIVPHADALQIILTSPLILAALALMSLPLLFGVTHLLRLSNHNLVLKTRFESTRQQRLVLRRHNERLQREIDRRFESEKKLAHQANYDQLTGLPNRSLALDRLTQAVKWARREGGSVQVLFLDLDRFKQVNDSLGHAAGDELLREAAQRLRAQMRDSDTVSRLGGDEFLVICPESADRGDWEQCARDLLSTLSQPFFIGDHEFFVGASIGVASFPEGGTEPLKLLKNADIAMYAAKEQGRNRYSYYDPSLDAAAVEAMKLENNLRHALSRDELRIELQPIVNLSSGRTVAVEALLRWTSRELGEVAPGKFIPVAEETGLIHEIGEWVLKEACRQVGTLHADRDFRVAVNLSTKQFSRPARLLDCTLQALRESGLMPSQLELEITESVLIDDRPEIGEFIGQLDRIGVRLSIDDFGTGYSALNYLQRFPFDILKIDRSFTREIPDSEANSSLIRAIIAMAHALGLEVIAEGIEERSQAGFLLVQHCELGQGFLYAKAMPLHTLREFLRSEQETPHDAGEIARVAANMLS